MNFIDEGEISVAAGRGGDGCVAFRREKFVPRGGPAGGDGGQGGSIWAVATPGLSTLYHLRRSNRYQAPRGRHGEGSCRTGASGGDLELPLPLGTVLVDADSGELLGELLEPGQRLLVAKGGRGGRGNARFATPTQRAPRRSEPGGRGQERRLHLELKLLADVGLVGLPNAGKSTLISVISAAQPKVADYPFTTLVPQLGVVVPGDWGEPFVVADLPGLIAGAAAGRGLGSRFLRHVDRCPVLMHLVDLSTDQSSAQEDLEVIEDELRRYSAELLERKRLVVGSKLDAAQERRREELRQAAAERGLQYLEVSAVTRRGLDELLGRLIRLLGKSSSKEAMP